MLEKYPELDEDGPVQTQFLPKRYDCIWRGEIREEE